MKLLNYYFPTSILLAYDKADLSLVLDIERWIQINGAVTRTIKTGKQLPANFVRAAKALMEQYLLDQWQVT